ncbi:lipocalin-like isoform X2 [Synchiropus splendidus]|uniref:lipocalin-like isoform X2 n=1 Tax=Synchiropus splendidus TaxID=270530 RepID=UPI00237D804B|nr:lipocalin-like isoform X2 [Synchiropus splendidus]
MTSLAHSAWTSNGSTMALLLTVLAGVLCLMSASSEVTPQPNFDAQGMAGKWYLIGFATNAEWFINRRASMKMGTAMFTPTAEGDLDMSYASLSPDGSCWRLNNLARKTNALGRFQYTSERWENQNEMYMVDVKYDEYALTHTIKTKGGESTVVNKLYGRGVDLSPEVKEKFKLFSLETGILPENIAFLPKNGECPAA